MNEQPKRVIHEATRQEYRQIIYKTILESLAEFPSKILDTRCAQFEYPDTFAVIEAKTKGLCGVIERNVGNRLLTTNIFTNAFLLRGKPGNQPWKKPNPDEEYFDHRVWGYHKILVIQHANSQRWFSFSPSNFQRDHQKHPFHIIDARPLCLLLFKINDHWRNMDWPNYDQICYHASPDNPVIEKGPPLKYEIPELGYNRTRHLF